VLVGCIGDFIDTPFFYSQVTRQRGDLLDSDKTGHTIEELLAEQERHDAEELEKRSHGVWDIPVLFVFAVLFSTVFLQFFTRYVLNDSIAWTEEAARYLLILLAFVGVIKCQLLDSHIRLEFIDQLFPRGVRWLKIIALTLTTGYFAFLGYALTPLARQTSFQSMVSLPFPKYYLYILILVALVVLVLVQLWQLVQALRGGDA
jgi:TRAP-type C4-dicarboxylate transport system permease small subunit